MIEIEKIEKIEICGEIKIRRKSEEKRRKKRTEKNININITKDTKNIESRESIKRKAERIKSIQRVKSIGIKDMNHHHHHRNMMIILVIVITVIVTVIVIGVHHQIIKGKDFDTDQDLDHVHVHVHDRDHVQERGIEGNIE